MIHPIKHFITITHHRHLVLKHCFEAGIPLRGLLHDLSKYSPAEFIPGARYWTGIRSPNDRERKELGYSKAWMHHKGRNKHHYEYWTDFSPIDGHYSPVKMPLKFVIEMVCDRIAAGKVYKGKDFTPSNPIEYFERRKNVDLIHPDTAALLEKILTMYSNFGEKETFRWIRKTLLKQKNY